MIVILLFVYTRFMTVASLVMSDEPIIVVETVEY